MVPENLCSFIVNCFRREIKGLFENSAIDTRRIEKTVNFHSMFFSNSEIPVVFRKIIPPASQIFGNFSAAIQKSCNYIRFFAFLPDIILIVLIFLVDMPDCLL